RVRAAQRPAGLRGRRTRRHRGPPAGSSERRHIRRRPGPTAERGEIHHARPGRLRGPPLRHLTFQAGAQLLLYGLPTAAGATARPMAPARTTIVTRYGSIPRNWIGMWTFAICSLLPNASEKANSCEAPKAPIGVHFPKIMAASAMKPRPPVILGRKLPICWRLK